jgi:hypothetical protein
MDMYPSPLLLSSKHQKEGLLQPIFEPFGLHLLVNEGFDTDAYGTFCGAIPRTEGPKITVKEKCLAGMSFAGKRQGLASEGSFGPHPSIPFLTINEEWLVYIDLDRKLEIFGRSTTLEVCHARLGYHDAAELPTFLTNCSFGPQGLVFKDTENANVLVKGIQDQTQLEQLMQQFPKWEIETDLRAHMNPQRQKNIIAAAKDLTERMHRYCPQCDQPDFSVQKVSGNLLCEICLQKSNAYQYLEYSCLHCQHQLIEQRKDKNFEDPQYCNHCNP